MALLVIFMAVGVLAGERYVTPRLGKWGGPCPVFGGTFVVLLLVFGLRGILAQDAAVNAAKRLAGTGQVDQAIELIRRAMDKEPTAIRAAGLGQILFDAGRWSEAADTFAVAQGLDPDAPLHAINRALAISKDGDPLTALEIVQEERGKAPQEAALALASAYLLSELDRDDEATEQHRQAVELGRIAGSAQRVDLVSHARLVKLCAEKLAGASVRGFPVVQRLDTAAPDPTGPAA
ncbi:MAG TPA: tetratricopeptide repeat protein [Tepidisphaeraceae bacterium]